ncbi:MULTISPECIES: SCO family protein [Pseudomonas]|nr:MULTISPECIES: SCO family protein [Pseudomonas]ARD12076.1 photosynthetic protein synthase I [Pseudomonas savastanoi pv. savastanoi NCPPB 3335]KAA3544710.1 SCO family protein [Pseudomonas savastanoi]KPB14421.1 Cytochrome oxidase bioproteinis protein Sco1/SenC/PrrC [Pseudomonas savastanoi]KPW65624.1 Cytochrome oxidase bioproteinsis protein Sco1/SenC/PrrC, putative copper metallochaperone [Pseudomonas amygdali pv. ciccaronei]KPX99463.1 Cytochrome oxidase bioproteinsis protein Sco1/SenC/PrrC, pu
MTYQPTRREVVTGLSLLSLGLLTGCGNSNALPFKHGKDMSNEIVGRNFRLKDAQGNVKTLSSFRGLMPMIFFGFTQCPAICPTALARAAQIRKLMGEEGKTLQVVFITLDPERDTPEVIDAYVKAFDPTFVALSGTLEETAAAAKEFGVFFEKVPLGDTYTISHTATSYVYDTRGVLRLGLSHRLSAQQCTEDLLTLMEVC